MGTSGSRAGRRRSAGTVLLALTVVTACGHTPHNPPPAATLATVAPSATPSPVAGPVAAPAVVPGAGDFTAVARLVRDAIAAPRLPGAVVQIGHGGNVVFRQAFGARKLPGEPGLDGAPAPAEPMTEDTIFDLASLTKSLATATAVLQLHEQGRLRIDSPVQTYLPDFNRTDDPQRGRVTVRMLLTHTSGLAGDLSRQGPWGLDIADKAEGIRRALAAPLEFLPGDVFHYSDIGFILLGAMIEKITGETEDTYVEGHVFGPLGMKDTRYLPPDKACGPHQTLGTATTFDRNGLWAGACPQGSWSTDLLRRIAPTAHDEENPDDPVKNPDYGRLLRGTVHDPTARRMGGVAGSAGLFSTVTDLGLFAQALLDRLAGRPSRFPLTPSTVSLMTTPQQPGHAPGQLEAANAAARDAVRNTPNRADPLLAAHYPAIAGQNLRGLGWDIDTPYSAPRGTVFPIGSFGHAGFTGTSLWIDPGSDTYVVVLANVIHQRGGPPVGRLSGEVATVAARALRLYGS